MVDCPACAGPAEVRVDCETCKGIMKVTQEVHDAFMIKAAKLEQANEFWQQVQSFIYQPGAFKFEVNGKVFELSDTTTENSEIES